jgi:glycosyltransferase involved in cell wall biosynthesis
MLAYAHYISDARIKSYVRTLQGHGHQVDVIALRSAEEAAVEELPTGTIFHVMEKYQGKSKLLYSWSYFRFFVKAALLLARLSIRERYDAIHVHNMPNALVFAAFFPKLLGARVMLDVHDLMTANYMAKFDASNHSLPVQILKIEQRLSSMFADHMFCADHNQQDYLVEECGIARKKITVMLNLPHAETFRRSTFEERKEDKVFRIVYHGTMAHRLGIDLILRAVARVVDRIPAELWMYGTGDFLLEALTLSSELGIDEKVHFNRKFFPVEQIPEIIGGMDLGIIGNRWNLACDQYMLPVKLLEYVYLGIPVVAPRLRVIARYFDDSMVRFYVPENVEQMADSIERLFHDREERERLARTAFRFFQEYNSEAQGNRYLDLLTGSNAGLATVPEHHT